MDSYNTGGTFFFIGQNISHYPGIVEKTGAAGHAIGNHSNTHPNMLVLSEKNREKELKAAWQILKKHTGKAPVLFRPPFGAVDYSLVELSNRLGMKVVMWNIDTRDWEAREPGEIADYVKNTDPSGKIYLFHENALTLEALPEIIEYLKEHDLQFVTLK